MQNAMAGEYGTITEGVILLLTIAFWNYALDWLGHHLPWFERILRAPPLLLIKDGQMLRRNMRQELITEEELMSQLRQQGCEDVGSVGCAYIEGDGRISIIRGRWIGGQRQRQACAGVIPTAAIKKPATANRAGSIEGCR